MRKKKKNHFEDEEILNEVDENANRFRIQEISMDLQLENYLESFGIPNIKDVFKRLGITKMENLKFLTYEDLKESGLSDLHKNIFFENSPNKRDSYVIQALEVKDNSEVVKSIEQMNNSNQLNWSSLTNECVSLIQKQKTEIDEQQKEISGLKEKIIEQDNKIEILYKQFQVFQNHKEKPNGF